VQQAGHSLDPRRLLAMSELDPELQRGALHRLAATDTRMLGPIYEGFGGLVSYDELRLLRLYLACRRAQDAQAKFEQKAVAPHNSRIVNAVTPDKRDREKI
jgi:ATP-dependent DNA helicase RecQ